MTDDLLIARCSAPGCTNPLPPRGRRGPAPVYCSPACRVAAWRSRARVHESTALKPAAWGQPDATALEAPATSSVPTDEQVARAILSGRGVAAALEVLGREARPEFAWRCEKAGEEITRVLDTYFEGADR